MIVAKLNSSYTAGAVGLLETPLAKKLNNFKAFQAMTTKLSDFS